MNRCSFCISFYYYQESLAGRTSSRHLIKDGFGSHSSAAYRHKPTNSRYGPYIYSNREQQNNVKQHEYTGKSNYCNNSKRDSNLRNYGYALSTRSNISYEKDWQDNNYGAQTTQGKGNNYYNSKYNCATSSTNRTEHQAARENVDGSTDNVESQNTNYKTLTQCSRNTTITSQNFCFATNNPVEPSDVQYKNETYSCWENGDDIPNIFNCNTSATQSNSDLLQSYPFSFKQQVSPSVPNSLDWQSILRINKSTSVGMQDNKGNIESVQSYSGSSHLSSCNEPNDDGTEGSVWDLQSIVSTSENTDEEIQQDEGNTESVQNSTNSKPLSKKAIRSAMRSEIRISKWKEVKKQMKLERQQARHLKLLTPDGIEFLKILGEATNLKIAVSKFTDSYTGTDSYTCTMEGPNGFKRKAKKAIQRFCNPFQAATPHSIIKLSVDYDITSVRQIFTKLNDHRKNWKLSAENLYKGLEQIENQITIRMLRLQANNFKTSKKYRECSYSLKKLREKLKLQYKILNAIILVILKIADAPVHIEALNQWILDGKETGNNSVENAFNYIFRNDTQLDIDYKQVMQKLPQGVNVSLIEKVGHLMTSGAAICEKFQWEDRLKLLKRLHANIIINNYSDNCIHILNMNVINLQQWLVQYGQQASCGVQAVLQQPPPFY